MSDSFWGFVIHIRIMGCRYLWSLRCQFYPSLWRPHLVSEAKKNLGPNVHKVDTVLVAIDARLQNGHGHYVIPHVNRRKKNKSSFELEVHILLRRVCLRASDWTNPSSGPSTRQIAAGVMYWHGNIPQFRCAGLWEIFCLMFYVSAINFYACLIYLSFTCYR